MDRIILYCIVVGIIGGGSWLKLEDWHYKPLREKDTLIEKYAEEYNKAYNRLYKCEQNTTVQSIENYIEGLDDGSTITDSRLDNLHS